MGKNTNMPHPLPGISIRTKLLMIIMSVSTLALVASSVLIVLFMVESFQKHLAETLATNAKMIANNSAAAVAFDDATDAATILDALKEQPPIAYAHVTRADETILASYRNPGFKGEPQPAPEPGTRHIGVEWVTTLEPIVMDGQAIGSVFIQSDLREMSTFRNQIIALVACIFITVLLAAFILSSTLQRLISKPVEHLTTTAKEISETRDFSLRAQHTSKDEVGLLTEAFNTMLSEIEQRTADLQQKDFVIDSSSTAIATFDLKGHVTYTNPTFRHQWGFECPTEVIGRPISDFMTFEASTSSILTTLNGPARKWSSEQGTAQRKDGSTFNVQTSAATVLNSSGKPVGLMATTVDITQRKLIEEERDQLLSATEKRVEELRCLYGVAESIRTQETIEQTIEDIVWLIPQGWHEPDITRARIQFNDNVYTTDPFEESEWKQTANITVNDQVEGIIEVYYTEKRPEQDEGPFPKESRDLLDNIARSIGEAIQHQRAETDRDRLLSAIEQAEETVIITDTDSTILYVSPSFERTTGYTREEAIGQSPSFLKSNAHEADFYQEIWATIGRGETWSGRLINRKKDGTLFTEEATISPVHDASGKTINYIAVKHDVTHEIELETQLQQAQKMEAVGQLAGGIAHDFNNLLQVIMGYGEIAIDDTEPGSSFENSVQEMMNASHRAKELVNQLLAFSRRQVLQMQEIDLNEIVHNMMKMIPRVIGEHIALNVITADDLSVVRADPGQIEQILMNLCVNSRDAIAESGSITIETERVIVDEEFQKTHTWATPGPYVALSVTDTGCGMDQDTQDKLFDPFFTTKGVGKGTGLGLSTVYGLVEQHNGGIHVYSEIGKGTSVKIYLPETKTKQREKEEFQPAAPVRTGTETILLAEDDQSVRDLTTAILTTAGYKVLVATDGDEAVTLFEDKHEEIDMVLLDIIMPKLGGKAAYERMSEIQPGTRALFASGYSMNALHTNFVLDEGLSLIQKPYHRDDLLRHVRKILDEG